MYAWLSREGRYARLAGRHMCFPDNHPQQNKSAQRTPTALSCDLHTVMKVAMTKCKISGFKQVLTVESGGQACLTDCVVDVAIPGSYGGVGKQEIVVSVACCVAAKGYRNSGACYWYGFQSRIEGNSVQLLSCGVLLTLAPYPITCRRAGEGDMLQYMLSFDTMPPCTFLAPCAADRSVPMAKGPSFK
jgi:hypothetical protein